MPLPFKTRPQLSENKRLALVRLKQLKRKFERNPRFKDDYIKFMDSVFKDGDAERAENQNPADHASRGLKVAELVSSTWLTGPKFLWEREIIAQKTIPQLMMGDPEVKKHPGIFPRDGVITRLIIGTAMKKVSIKAEDRLSMSSEHMKSTQTNRNTKMSDLPANRVIPHHQFLSVGWIVLGPFLLSRVAESISG
ncbi:hypothetical protein FQN60_016201 [Etheostoma spectabile]|uniref:Uncharacterized protein n=1 Tax=Etheostoma spectabile TaxID=54343 RepID=A0A5J5D1I4_9PERO|nr:hypothetical protein FQN60_016201 [Etheostoma spectabile]